MKVVNVILFGKRIFADIINLEKLLWIIQEDPKCHHSVLIRGKQREISHRHIKETQRREGVMQTGAEIGARQPPKAGRSKERLLP